MKRSVPYIVAACMMLLSCGEDRTHEYVEKTARDHWMFDVMQQEYLWGKDLHELAWKDYFAAPSEFFSKLTKQASVKDSWSWCATDTLKEDFHERGYFNHLNSYGMDFMVMTDPTGATSRQYARILTVYDNSPAARCGLKRGDFISSVDGAKFTNAEAKKLKNGKSHTLGVEHLGTNLEEGTLVWLESETVEMSASEYVEDVAFPVSRILDSASGKVGYLMCNRLTEGPREKNASATTYRDALNGIMTSFAGQELRAFVLDLRLCNDGTLEMANRLASYFVKENGKVFAKTIYNENKSHLNSSVTFDETGVSQHLDVKTLYVITSAYTQGASEWLIRSLRHAMGDSFVITVGVKSAGQIVMTGSIPSDYFITLHPAVAYVANADGDHNYASGIPADMEYNEQTAIYLYPYGDDQEFLLNNILSRE